MYLVRDIMHPYILLGFTPYSYNYRLRMLAMHDILFDTINLRGKLPLLPPSQINKCWLFVYVIDPVSAFCEWV